MDHLTLRKLLRTAKREIISDMVIRGGRVVNVFINRIDENVSILIKAGYIASIEDGAGQPSTRASRIVDADGLYLCPGFIDAHTHLDTMAPFYELVPHAIRGGTTTVVTECGQLPNPAGYPLLIPSSIARRAIPCAATSLRRE